MAISLNYKFLSVQNLHNYPIKFENVQSKLNKINTQNIEYSTIKTK